MLIIGLTGSIGMGKSTAAQRFRNRGIPVCDADAEVHKVYEGAAVGPIEATFPGTTSQGKVDRTRLATALLANPSGFKRLEAIVHPLVVAAERNFLHEARRSGAPMVVLEIPLLLETGGDARVDVVVVVSAPAEMQRARVLSRPGMTLERLDAILARQMPDEDKRRRADFVVDTSGTIAASEAQVDRLIADLQGRTGSAFAAHWA